MRPERHPLHEPDIEPYLKLQHWLQAMEKVDARFREAGQIAKMMMALAYKLTSYLYDEEIIEQLVTSLPYLRDQMRRHVEQGLAGAALAEDWRPSWDEGGGIPGGVPISIKDSFIDSVVSEFSKELEHLNTPADLEDTDE